jgi:glucose-1-phosphate cytidylyltransferase
MKVVILAGGLGTRISEETDIKPKPMIEIGNYPIIWHIMKIYSFYGFNDFIICLGHKGHVIKEYFSNYFLNHSDITFNLINPNEKVIHSNCVEPWKVTLVNTGDDSLTGGRVKRIQKYTENKPFMLTYGDGLANINIKKLVEHHKVNGKLATVTAIQYEGRFGTLNLTPESRVNKFEEKVKKNDDWINGGFFVLQPEIFNYIDGDHTIFEKEPLEKLAEEGQLYAYKHTGFWHPMDTLRDKNELLKLWNSGKAPWKIWE